MADNTDKTTPYPYPWHWDTSTIDKSNRDLPPNIQSRPNQPEISNHALFVQQFILTCVGSGGDAALTKELIDAYAELGRYAYFVSHIEGILKTDRTAWIGSGPTSTVSYTNNNAMTMDTI